MEVGQPAGQPERPAAQAPGLPATPDQVLDFWFGLPGTPGHGSVRRIWFTKDAAFDRQVRERFLPTVEAAERGALDGWDAPGASAEQRAALVIVCDQFPRNLFRGQARAFALDARALAVARSMVARGEDRALSPLQRWFVYLPFEHAESREDQRESLRLFGLLRDDPAAGQAWDWAVRHAEVIERFGRFPHRNAALGRASTPEEIAFLRQPGSRF